MNGILAALLHDAMTDDAGNGCPGTCAGIAARLHAAGVRVTGDAGCPSCGAPASGCAACGWKPTMPIAALAPLENERAATEKKS